ncbi:MAG TPA: type VI secretion system accessory protein TagJ [Gemmatimonadaceae bacterium]|jgi:type VI secretion system protein ImpE
MPTAQELYTAGRLNEAIERLGVELRDRPTDARQRTFLFELLTFAGQYDRADKQLDVLARQGTDAEAGTLVYKSALGAERLREQMFDTGQLPTTDAPHPVSGTLNGRPFQSIEDADPRVGPRLEVIAGGRYMWVPFAYLSSISIEAPKRLRDIRWLPARMTTGPQIHDLDLGEIMLPSLSPAAWKAEDDELRLGRAADWSELPDGDYAPLGQKLLRVDDELIPLLDVRELVIAPPTSEHAPE